METVKTLQLRISLHLKWTSFPLWKQSKFQSTCHIFSISACCIFSIDVLYTPKRGSVDGCILEQPVSYGRNRFLYCSQPQKNWRGVFCLWYGSIWACCRQTSCACLAGNQTLDIIVLEVSVGGYLAESFPQAPGLTWVLYRSFWGRSWGGSWMQRRVPWPTGSPPWSRRPCPCLWQSRCAPSPCFHSASRRWRLKTQRGIGSLPFCKARVLLEREIKS